MNCPICDATEQDGLTTTTDYMGSILMQEYTVCHCCGYQAEFDTGASREFIEGQEFYHSPQPSEMMARDSALATARANWMRKHHPATPLEPSVTPDDLSTTLDLA